MSEILKNQKFEINNVLSYREKMLEHKINQRAIMMKNFIKNEGSKCMGSPITATFGINVDNGNRIIDVEILIPVDRKIDHGEEYVLKEQFKLENALMIRHIGNPMLIQESFNELNQYIMDNHLVPITVGYNVTVNSDAGDIENTEIDIYVGISPNVL